MRILDDRSTWAEAFRNGWLAHLQETQKPDWKRYNRPTNTTTVSGKPIDLRQSRLLLISSSGAYLRESQPPFDAANVMGDYTIRCFPHTTPFTDLAYAHDHYDHTAVDADPQVLVPLGHLTELVRGGAIGSLTPSVVSFMGYQPDVEQVLDKLIPAIVAVAMFEAADAALLVPS